MSEIEMSNAKSPLSAGWLARAFRLTEHQSTVRTEVLAGLTTFLTMSYTIFVQSAVALLLLIYLACCARLSTSGRTRAGGSYAARNPPAVNICPAVF